jgi:DNA-binding NarL/FixJ family response regulator
MKTIRILLAEDHALVRDGLRLLLQAQDDMTLVADTDDGARVAELVLEHCPDILLLDIGLPGLDGLGVLQELAETRARPHVLVVTARLDAASARAVFAMGAAGYLTKSEDSARLLEAIRDVAAGRRYVSPDIAELLAAGVDGATGDGTAILSLREREVLIQVGRGLSSKEIGRALGISDLTVRKHRENLCRKLGLRSSAELVAYAIRNGATRE